MPETPEGSNGVGEAALAALIERVAGHFREANDCRTVGRGLALGFDAWLSAGAATLTADQRDALLTAIAGTRVAISDTVSRASLPRIDDGLDAFAEDVAAAAGALLFHGVDQAAACRMRILQAQAEAAIVNLLVGALFDEPEARPRALAHAAEWQARSTRLAFELGQRHRPCGHAV